MVDFMEDPMKVNKWMTRGYPHCRKPPYFDLHQSISIAEILDTPVTNCKDYWAQKIRTLLVTTKSFTVKDSLPFVDTPIYGKK